MVARLRGLKREFVWPGRFRGGCRFDETGGCAARAIA